MCSAKRMTFASSSAASISSMTQNGVGRTLMMAKYSAMATKAVSPPESSESVVSALPGGWTLISMSQLSTSLAGLERELRLAAAEELREGLAEALVYRGELAGEYSSHFPGYVGNYTQQLIFRLLHVVALGGEELVALADARVLVDGAEVRRAEGAHLLLELGYAAVRLCRALDGLTHGLRRAVAELVAVPELVQELLLLHLGGELLLLEPGTGALHVEQGVVLLLHGLVGARALALDLQLLLRGGG